MALMWKGNQDTNPTPPHPTPGHGQAESPEAEGALQGASCNTAVPLQFSPPWRPHRPPHRQTEEEEPSLPKPLNWGCPPGTVSRSVSPHYPVPHASPHTAAQAPSGAWSQMKAVEVFEGRRRLCTVPGPPHLGTGEGPLWVLSAPFTLNPLPQSKAGLSGFSPWPKAGHRLWTLISEGGNAFLAWFLGFFVQPPFLLFPHSVQLI